MNNTSKYSQATEVKISLLMQQQQIVLTYFDNGVGFDMQHYPAGNGLQNMQKRAAFLNGTLSIKSAINEGVNIVLTLLPLA